MYRNFTDYAMDLLLWDGRNINGVQVFDPSGELLNVKQAHFLEVFRGMYDPEMDRDVVTFIGLHYDELIALKASGEVDALRNRVEELYAEWVEEHSAEEDSDKE